MAKPRAINAAGLDLIKSFESCRLLAYKDSGGVWTIGWGHTPARKDNRITQDRADQLLALDLLWAERAVTQDVTVTLTPNQFAALVSFTFNLGPVALGKSTLLRMLNAGDYTGAANEFRRWNKDNGEVVAGLTRRRTAEKDLFTT